MIFLRNVIIRPSFGDTTYNTIIIYESKILLVLQYGYYVSVTKSCAAEILKKLSVRIKLLRWTENLFEVVKIE